MAHIPTSPIDGGERRADGEATPSRRLDAAGDDIREDLRSQPVSAEVDVDGNRLTITFVDGLAPFARGVVARAADRHSLAVEWDGDVAAVTPE